MQRWVWIRRSDGERAEFDEPEGFSRGKFVAVRIGAGGVGGAGVAGLSKRWV
jgi:hypothetical protein